jgi:hypothetical protein
MEFYMNEIVNVRRDLPLAVAGERLGLVIVDATIAVLLVPML